MTPPKLSDLTPTDKIRMAAALDGFVDIKPVEETNAITGMDFSDFLVGTKEREFAIPNYYESYDAIIPLIQKQGDRVKLRIAMQLAHGDALDNLEATPSQLLDALLVATGKATI